MKKIVRTDSAPAPIGPYSQAVDTGDFVFVSGQLGLDPLTMKLRGNSAEEQAKQAMENIRAILRASGLEMKHIVKTTILLKNLDDFARVNQVYGTFFEGEFPSRATYQVARLPMDALVEIEAIARRW